MAKCIPKVRLFDIFWDNFWDIILYYYYAIYFII